MDKIFWVTCPECEKRFYADMELRHSEWKLICPFCKVEFRDEESPEVTE